MKATWKHEAACKHLRRFYPSQNSITCVFRQFELNRSVSFTLDHGNTFLESIICQDIGNRQSYQVTSARGLGYPAGDGFEARNALFKGFVGLGKAVTFHDNPGKPLLQVFEGFLDFLSYLSADKRTQPAGAVLVLNSTNLWRRALPYINDPRFEEVRLYLDNDEAGSAATGQLFEEAEATKLVDMRSHYAGFEDLNAWLLGKRL